jgi:hypothetical protein
MNAKLNGWLWRVICIAIGLIFGAGVAWGVMRTQVRGLDKTVTNHEERLRDVEDGFARIETKLDYLIEQSK